MNMNWLESLLFGLVSGISEFLPVSSHGHQKLLLHLFGMQENDPVRSLIIHIAMFLALYFNLKGNVTHPQVERGSRRHGRSTSPKAYDLRLVKNAAIPMIICICVFTYIFNRIDQLPVVVIFFIINGILLFLPERMMIGNKDARSMTVFDSLLIGFMGALSAFSGISRLGAIVLAAQARGSNRSKGLCWFLLLSAPALIMLIIIDFFTIATGGAIFSFWGNLVGYILSGIGAFATGYLGIILVKYLNVQTGYTAFAYYSWGIALLTFLLYLAVV